MVPGEVGESAKGGVGRFDLSYDAKRIVFPYATPRNPPTSYGIGKPGVRGGSCHMYDGGSNAVLGEMWLNEK